MQKRRLFRRAVPMGAALTGMFGIVVGVGAGPSSATPKPSQFTVVASGFDNPRGLTFGEDGQLYVAEAGKGGPTCVSGGPGGGSICPGLTSAISVISTNGTHHRIVSGLGSVSDVGGFGATGLDGVSFKEDAGLYGIITSCPQQVDQLPPNTFDPAVVEALKDQAGQEIKVTEPGEFKTVAPVGKVDWQWALDHKSLVPTDFPDCNPYGIVALSNNSQWVVDAASNTIDHVESGRVDVEKFVPNPASSDAVPTCIAKGPDGALYISQLLGGGNVAGAANVWRFDPRSESLTVWASGLTAVTGCGFGPDGKFYATEFSTTSGFENAGPGDGAVVRVHKNSTTPEVVATGLSFPNGFAASGDAVYVSNWSISIANPPQGGPPPGSVVKIAVHTDQDDD
jgi:hypothetical protein